MNASAGSKPTVDSIPLLRPRYFARQLVTDADLTADQAYVGERLRRANRLLHGYGVVCGLEVLLPVPTKSDGPPTVIVTPGFALGPQGDEIEVPVQQQLTIDCAERLVPDCKDLNATPQKQRVYLVVRYVEEQVKPVPALPNGCVPAVGCEFSRFQADFGFEWHTELPPTSGQLDCATLRCVSLTRTAPAPTAGSPELFACAPKSAETGVVLAAIDLSPEEGIGIDYSVRTQLLSTQRMLALLRCKLSEPPPAISAIEPWRASQGTTLEVAIVGAGLGGATDVTFSGGGIAAVMLREPFARLRDVWPSGDVIFSPDGRLIASVATKGVQLWDAQSGRLIMTLADDAHVDTLTFSPDGHHIAAGLKVPGEPQAAETRIWDVFSGETIRKLPYSSQLAYSPGGRYFYLSAKGDGGGSQIEMRRAVDGELIRTMESIDPELVVSPDSRLLLTFGQAGMHVHETHGFALASDLPHLRAGDVTVVRPIFSSDGRRIVTVDPVGTTVRLADAYTGDEIRALPHDNPVAEVAVSREGRLLVTRDVLGTLRLWDMNDWGELDPPSDWGHIQNFALSPDGRLIAVGLGDVTVRLQDLGAGRELALLPHPAAPQVVAFSPDGRTLITRWKESNSSTTAGLWPVESPAQCALVRLSIHAKAQTGEHTFQVVTPCGVLSSAMSKVSFRVEPVAQ
jgi:WD40 repeat protein